MSFLVQIFIELIYMTKQWNKLKLQWHINVKCIELKSWNVKCNEIYDICDKNYMVLFLVQWELNPTQH